MIRKIKLKILIILDYLILLIIYILYYGSLIEGEFYKTKFIQEIKKIYEIFNKVNINEVDNKIYGKSGFNDTKIQSVINIGFTLDKDYILETMITVASIMATQKNTTKIRFHFGVTNNFTADNMIKIYDLRNKINNLSEFNFYYLKESVYKMKDFHPSGEACPGKFELPIYLPDDIERLIIFDAGDLIVLRDLTELYNYDMGQYWVLGTLEPSIINTFTKIRYNITKYINIGSILLNIKYFKQNNFWSKYTSSRNLTIIGKPDQTLFNILLPDEKKDYLPFKFGGFTLFHSDKNFDKRIFDEYGYNSFFKSNLSLLFPDNPKSDVGIIFNLYNPVFIHQFYGKWKLGKGLSIYRHLVKYFILLTGISKEICKKYPGYCH